MSGAWGSTCCAPIGHRGRARADLLGERFRQARGGPGRESLPRGQRRHLAVEAAQARTGADLRAHSRGNRNHRRQPSSRGQDPHRRLRQDHSGERQGPARLQAGPARSANDRGREEGLPGRDRRLRGGRGRGRLPRTDAAQPPGARSSSSTAASMAAPRFSSSTPTSPSRPRRRSSSGSRSARIHRGHFGLHTVAEIPAIAGGAGSATEFELNIEPQVHLQGQEAELPHRQLPDRELLHRRGSPVQRRHDDGVEARPALHADG